ncbi:hypothetical protein T06_10224 [Trichinella sp. T6]|nr:hypothetical protein T06_10224 [Trichinella sp. T6]
MKKRASNCSERPYKPLGEVDALAAAAWTITDVTPPSYASKNERWREERWRPSTRRPVAWSPSQANSGRKLQGAARPMQLGDGRTMAACVWGYRLSTTVVISCNIFSFHWFKYSIFLTKIDELADASLGRFWESQLMEITL